MLIMPGSYREPRLYARAIRAAVPPLQPPAAGGGARPHPKNTVFDKKTLQCGPDVHILIETEPLSVALATDQADPMGQGSATKCAGRLPPRQEKADSNTTRELNVIIFQQNCALHRWRQPICDGQDARFRYRL